MLPLCLPSICAIVVLRVFVADVMLLLLVIVIVSLNNSNDNISDDN